MSMTVSDFLLQRLSAWGIRRIFGFPGNGITGIIAALDRAGDKFDFVQVRHEEMALSALGGNYQQEVDLVPLFKDVAGEYVHMASSPDQGRHLIDRAVRIAKAERTVTCLIMPNDVQELEAVEKPPRAHGTIHSGLGYSAPRTIPTEADLHRAAEALNAGTRRRNPTAQRLG